MESHPKRKKHIKQQDESVTGQNELEPQREGEDKAEAVEARDVDALKKKVDDKEKEAKENYDRLLRAVADLENYKKRAAREKEEWVKFANEDLIKAILPAIDNLERAVDHSENVAEVQGLVEGLKLTIQQLLQALGKFGLSSVESVGKPFDPAFHEAMLVVQTDECEPNHVVQEFQRGYLLNDRLIRPATVSVSKSSDQENR